MGFIFVWMAVFLSIFFLLFLSLAAKVSFGKNSKKREKERECKRHKLFSAHVASFQTVCYHFAIFSVEFFARTMLLKYNVAFIVIVEYANKQTNLYERKYWIYLVMSEYSWKQFFHLEMLRTVKRSKRQMCKKSLEIWAIFFSGQMFSINFYYYPFLDPKKAIEVVLNLWSIRWNEKFFPTWLKYLRSSNTRYAQNDSSRMRTNVRYV